MPNPPIIKDLTLEQEAMVIEDAISAVAIDVTIKKLGFNSRTNFYDYCKRHPVFHEVYKVARRDGCMFLEDDILHVVEKYPDPQQARVHMEALCRVLAFRDPAKYSPKVDLQVTHVDLTKVLQSAEERIAIDVTPKLKGFEDIE